MEPRTKGNGRGNRTEPAGGTEVNVGPFVLPRFGYSVTEKAEEVRRRGIGDGRN